MTAADDIDAIRARAAADHGGGMSGTLTRDITTEPTDGGMTTPTGLTFRVEPRPFASAVSFVAKHLPTRPEVPVLAGLLLDVADGQLTVAGFDYNIATHAEVDVVGECAGHVLVSGRLLAEVGKTFPDKPVDVRVDDTRATITCGAVRLGLPLMNVEDYPTPPGAPTTIGTATAADIAALIERVSLAVDRSGTGGIKAFHGIHLRFDSQRITAHGTDRFRAATGHIGWNADLTKPISTLVPAPMLLDIARALDGADTVTIGADEHLVSFAIAGRTMIARQLSETYPAQVEAIFPARVAAPAVVPVPDLLVAMKRADLVRAPKSPVMLTFAAGQLAIAAKGEVADTGDAIDCQYDGPELTLGINPQYLGDALAGLRADTAEISFTDARRPVLLTIPDDTGAEPAYRHVVVPIQTVR
ncbi:DNA polymerase III subunit beta [Rhizomonospora bruguierae]|uniref:DNA polymerase III subunit beta n=1 Tax=Rhizomonospora bruguierae TaxID=1581705 RepID=UPI001BCC2DBA|nr:DNA polymerase III subunit beta [Micromonospora sp. NBRC 107566]